MLKVEEDLKTSSTTLTLHFSHYLCGKAKHLQAYLDLEGQKELMEICQKHLLME